MIKKLKEKLTFMQKCYDERNIENVDALMVDIFGSEGRPIIIGTGNDEWSFEEKSLRELFVNDWKYWGDFVMNLDSLQCSYNDKFGNFSVPAGVSYDVDDEKNYKRLLDSFKDVMESNNSALYKLSYFLWRSSLTLSPRENSKRKYISELNLTGIFEIVNNEPILRSLHFAVAMDINAPDITIEKEKMYSEGYEETQTSLQNYIAINKTTENQKKTDSIIEKILALLHNEKACLSTNNQDFFISTNFKHYDSLQFKGIISSVINDGYKINIDKNNIYISQSEDEFYFIGIGSMISAVDLEHEVNNIFKNIDCYNNIGSNKDTIFALRRDLAYVLNKYSISQTCTAPIRIEGRGVVNGCEDIIINYFKLSYPNDWFLEDKTKYVRSI